MQITVNKCFASDRVINSIKGTHQSRNIKANLRKDLDNSMFSPDVFGRAVHPVGFLDHPDWHAKLYIIRGKKLTPCTRVTRLFFHSSQFENNELP